VDLRVLSLQREYHERVVAWTLDELRAGRTPSPDVLCNRTVKFGAFLDLLDADPEMERFDFVASGHYARLRRDGHGDGSVVRLLRAVDPVKDQTYFLFQLAQRQLRRVLFPLGDLRKAEVRDQAARLRLPNRDRKDSQGLCFLGKIRFEDFVRAHLGDRPGPIRRLHPETGAGTMLGQHQGHWFHTVGQRRGLGLHGGPWYVVAKDVSSDTVWVSHGDDLDRFSGRRFAVGTPHWVLGAPPPAGDLHVRVRHGPKLLPARWLGMDGATGEVILATGDSGLAPGQVAVFYRGEECLGGGTIEPLADAARTAATHGAVVTTTAVASEGVKGDRDDDIDRAQSIGGP
jgi:tRNA-specific 2-thiouridylase